ncbi:MAG: C40 family peptidase [Treponema sp.]|nr:C40 family peptidase [Treponema sp.]
MNMKTTPTHKICFFLILIFSLACFKLCAETNSISPGQAQTMREKFIDEIKTHIGAPYEYGAIGPDSFDCSGLIYYSAQKSIQVQLPRTAKAIYNYARIISDEKREIGDLLFFKTTESSTISHIGVYIGNSQFISAISDGVNTGVIVSSLNQDYWKGRYVSTGQFLPSGKDDYKNGSSLAETEMQEPFEYQADDNTSKVNKTITVQSASFADNLLFDTSVFFDWSLLSPRQFVFRYRGIDAGIHASYAGWNLNPGIGIYFRFNSGLDTFQIPLVLSLSMNEFLRVYAGPVFTFDDVTLIDSDKEIKGSVFPGIIGISLSTPRWNIGKLGLQAVQDINYTVYNKMDGSALPFMESVAAGLVMYTGIRVTVPLSAFYARN